MTSRKTILILMHNAATQFIDIANQYAKLFDTTHYKVTVVYLSGEMDEQAKKRTLAEEVIFFDLHKKTIRGLKITVIRKLIALCRQEKFSLAICHRYKPIYSMLWAARFCPIPKIIFVMHAMKTLQHFSRKLLIAALSQKNMYFAGVSNAVRDDLRNSLLGISQEKIITLYNCIDRESTEQTLLPREEARSLLQLKHDTLVFGTIGRLAPEKDQKNMIQAFAKLQPLFPQAKLIIMGDGALEKDLKQLAVTLNIADAVIFTGFIPQAPRYLKAFDIFVLSSTKEAFGRVLLEAMVAKIPLIGTRADGIPEVIGDAGRLIPTGDIEKLEMAMKELAGLTTIEREEWGEKGYARMKKFFTLEKFHDGFWAQNPLL